MSKPLVPHLLMPMSGQGERYRAAGYNSPKPLIPISGVPMVQRLLQCFPTAWPAHFVLADNHMDSGLPELLHAVRPNARILSIPPHTLGPGHALAAALDGLPDDAPVFVSYCDYGMVWDAEAFVRFVTQSDCDACLVSYRGFHAHYVSPTPYAYARLEGERVREVREKGCFTANREDEYASTGGYYFRTAALLRQALAHQRQTNASLNGEFYTSLTVAALLASQPEADVRVFEIPRFFQWGTPEDLVNFEFWERSYAAANRAAGSQHTAGVDQVLMPMAGLGSRFAGLTPQPKPLIPVAGQAMFAAALASLPRPERTVIVALDEMANAVAGAAPYANTEVVRLASTPPGQALSTYAGLDALQPDREVLVSACDHGIVLPATRWNAFRQDPQCDAAIFTMAGFPGAGRRPKAYAYVVPKPGDLGPYPEVARVSVKQPVSEQPGHDHVLVGTFWFRTAAILRAAIDALRAHPVQVNGELYLDSVFTGLIASGHTVRMLPLDGFICWGEPDTLAEALYWYETFCARTIVPRPRLPGVAHEVSHAPL